jgi:hypothetical protein
MREETTLFSSVAAGLFLPDKVYYTGQAVYAKFGGEKVAARE